MKEPKASTSVSPTGMKMDSIIAKLKMHKTHKGMNDCLGKMHGAISGVPREEGRVKKAYFAGMKYAEESIMSDDSTGKEHKGTVSTKSQAEDVIKTIRRGWPDLSNEERRGVDSVEDSTDPDSSLDVAKEKAKLTPHSPDTTV